MIVSIIPVIGEIKASQNDNELWSHTNKNGIYQKDWIQLVLVRIGCVIYTSTAIYYKI